MTRTIVAWTIVAWTIVAWTIVAWTIDGGVGCNLPTHLSVFAVEISDFELID
jgi:hypothetical protein